MGKFTIFKSPANGQFYFRLRAANNEIILSSEGYIYKSSCKDGIESVKKNAPLDSRYTKADKPANFTFNLTGANGEIIGKSESYVTSSGRDNGIAAVKREAPGAWTEDIS
ncbi:uncharacterized protein YegP (UPF0339 family) [Pedobacter sp. CG_S7]|uniref:YegP family protein n=1 Tax=Pedobacter sp. CG_S7 TaxID=3143930 RepID=UPI0033990F17